MCGGGGGGDGRSGNGAHFSLNTLRKAAHTALAEATSLPNSMAMFVTRETSNLEILVLKEYAPMNIQDMLVTRDTSHFEMSKYLDMRDISFMLVTPEAFLSPIGP